MAPVKGWHWLTLLLFLGCLSGCQLPAPVAQVQVTSDPPRDRIEAVLPSVLDHVAQVRVHGPATGKSILGPQDGAFEVTAEQALRIALASCVRFYCTPDERAITERMGASPGIVLDFLSPQDVPTSLPLPGWFGPLRGREEMERVEGLYLILEPGQWAEVTARHADGTWSCWKSNWGW